MELVLDEEMKDLLGYDALVCAIGSEERRGRVYHRHFDH